MVKEIRKEVIGLLGKWIKDIRKFAVKFVGLVFSLWILAGVLGIGILGPVYLMKFFFGKSDSKIERSEAVRIESAAPRVQRYQPVYRIKPVQVKKNQPLTDGIREARNTASEVRSFARVVSVIGRV